MQVVTIPFNYEELSPSEQAGIVPICIRSADDEGNPIDWGWFEATARVQDPLRTLARSWLHDVWRVSEITEAAVQSLWRKHGHHLGRSPSRRVYVAARWQAQDKKLETWQSRRGVLLALDDLEQVVRQRVLVDPADYGRVYEDDLYFKELSARLESEGLEHVSHTLKLLRDGCTWTRLVERSAKVLTQPVWDSGGGSPGSSLLFPQTIPLSGSSRHRTLSIWNFDTFGWHNVMSEWQIRRNNDTNVSEKRFKRGYFAISPTPSAKAAPETRWCGKSPGVVS